MYDFVSPERVMNALVWLTDYTPNTYDVMIN